jgi:quinol monooxygenase YgiN
MPQSIIAYTFKTGSEEAWRRRIATMIGEMNADPDLTGRIAYRVLKERNGQRYWHVASAVDDDALKALQGKDYFRSYQAATREAAAGTLEVIGTETVAETTFRG